MRKRENVLSWVEATEKEFNTDLSHLKVAIDEVYDELENMEQSVDELTDEVLVLEEKSPVEFEDKSFNNLRTQSAYQKLLDNVAYIPIDALEDFITKHAKI